MLFMLLTRILPTVNLSHCVFKTLAYLDCETEHFLKGAVVTQNQHVDKCAQIVVEGGWFATRFANGFLCSHASCN